MVGSPLSRLRRSRIIQLFAAFTSTRWVNWLFISSIVTVAKASAASSSRPSTGNPRSAISPCAISCNKAKRELPSANSVAALIFAGGTSLTRGWIETAATAAPNLSSQSRESIAGDAQSAPPASATMGSAITHGRIHPSLAADPSKFLISLTPSASPQDRRHGPSGPARRRNAAHQYAGCLLASGRSGPGKVELGTYGPA